MEFHSIHGGDEELMRTWFANATMCDWDNHFRVTNPYENDSIHIHFDPNSPRGVIYNEIYQDVVYVNINL
jgi:hypothetical protein